MIKHRSKGIYLLPNLFTTAGLFAGFYAIVAAMQHYFTNAAIAIFIAMIADSLDGRVARLTNTESAFGAQYDSLSDMIAFGLAPALVIYSWSLHSLGKLGWLASFIFAAGGALRLARFNVEIGTADKRYFKGLPIPAAAAVIAGLVWFVQALHWSSKGVSVFLALLTVVIGGLMVSNFRYHSFKDVNLKKHVPFVMVLLVVLLFVFISVDPPSVLFFISLAYALHGPIWSMMKWRRALRRRKLFKSKQHLRQTSGDE